MLTIWRDMASGLIALAGLVAAPAWAGEPCPDLRMNQIQVIATHNSYHVRPTGVLGELNKRVDTAVRAWDYSHAPLNIQLDRGVRSFELDLYAYPGGTAIMHVPLYDSNASCSRLVECLLTVKSWSEAHPNHVPILFLCELKQEMAPFALPLPFDEKSLDQIDHEARTVLGDKLITPDEVRGNYPTLREAVEQQNWPKLEAVRGRVMLVLHTQGKAARLYTQNRPSLEGRALFLESEEGAPFAAVFVRNEPTDPDIPRLVTAGYIVRTRADSDIQRVKQQQGDQREQALASGAQVVSTDFPPGEAEPEHGYVMTLPGGIPARVNPVNGPANCQGQPLEATE